MPSPAVNPGHPPQRPSSAPPRRRCRRAAERHRIGSVARESTPRLCQSPPIGEACGPDRAAEVEGEDPGAGIAPELQRHQRQKHTLAGTRRADHQGVADIADMERKAEQEGVEPSVWP